MEISSAGIWGIVGRELAGRYVATGGYTPATAYDGTIKPDRPAGMQEFGRRWATPHGLTTGAADVPADQHEVLALALTAPMVIIGIRTLRQNRAGYVYLSTHTPVHRLHDLLPRPQW